MILAPMIGTCFTVFAEQVYGNVDTQGVVEFSDQPNADAQETEAGRLSGSRDAGLWGIRSGIRAHIRRKTV